MDLQIHCAKLELFDNDDASQCLKRDFISIRDNEMVRFHKLILSVREEIINKHKKKKR